MLVDEMDCRMKHKIDSLKGTWVFGTSLSMGIKQGLEIDERVRVINTTRDVMC